MQTGQERQARRSSTLYVGQGRHGRLGQAQKKKVGGQARGYSCVFSGQFGVKAVPALRELFVF